MNSNEMRGLVEHAVDPLVALNMRGQVVGLNAVASDTLALSLGRTFASAVLPTDRDEVLAAMQTWASGEAVEALTVGIAARNGDGHRTIAWTGSRSRDRVVLVGRDVTDTGRVEAENRFSDRMASLATFASGVAHEINNPLAAILANMQFVQAELTELSIEDADVSEALDDAIAGARRIGEVVSGLKMVSGGQGTAETERFDPKDVGHAALSMVRSQDARGVSVELQWDATGHVEGPRGGLTQVIYHLLLNAMEAASNTGKTEAQVWLLAHDDGDDGLVIDVEDNGAGPSAASIPRMYDAFYTTRPIGQAVGLGLWICHHVVTKMEGSLRFDRIKGRTRFRVRLPAHQPQQGAPTPKVTQRSHRGARVVVIDRDPLMGASLRRWLSKRYDVDVFEDGKVAIAKLACDQTPDLILCDLQTLDVGGENLHARLAEQAPALLHRVVFMARGGSHDASNAFLSSVPMPVVDKGAEIRHFVALVEERIADTRRSST